MSNLYFAKVPLRNTYLRLRNRVMAAKPGPSILGRYEIDVVLDVGANNGQFGRHLIRDGFQGRIVSFEPLPVAQQKLRMNRWGFKNWSVQDCGLSDYDGTATLNVSGNTQSSSIQGIKDTHVSAAPASAYVGTTEIAVRRLDSCFDEFVRPGESSYLKLDVQGHEHKVLDGAAGCMDRITAIQMEVSLQPLYDDSPIWLEAIASVESHGYQLLQLQPGFGDARTGEMLQADAIFVKSDAVAKRRAA